MIEMYSLTVTQRGLEKHPVIREILRNIEDNGVMHQGLGPGELLHNSP